jgi:hypothetical protein
MERSEPILSARLNELWLAYESFAAEARRKEKLAALEHFLAELTVEPMVGWSGWACDIARRVVDGGESIIIPMPLYREAIFPALLMGYKNSSPGCARWLAGLSQHLYRCRDCQKQLPLEEQSEVALLQVAIRADPDDTRSQRNLLAAWAEQLSFSLHEIPSGVLYDINGATADQCLELQVWIEEFASLAAKLQEMSKYLHLIEAGRYHFREYRNYLLSRGNSENYANYLSSGRKQESNINSHFE